MLRHHSCSSKFNFKREIRFIENARYKKDLELPNNGTLPLRDVSDEGEGCLEKTFVTLA